MGGKRVSGAAHVASFDVNVWHDATDLATSAAAGHGLGWLSAWFGIDRANGSDLRSASTLLAWLVGGIAVINIVYGAMAAASGRAWKPTRSTP